MQPSDDNRPVTRGEMRQAIREVDSGLASRFMSKEDFYKWVARVEGAVITALSGVILWLLRTTG